MADINKHRSFMSLYVSGYGIDSLELIDVWTERCDGSVCGIASVAVGSLGQLGSGHCILG